MNESVDTVRDSLTVVTEPVPDLQLQLLIQLLDRGTRSGLPLTLTIPAGVLHGDVIGHEEWKADWSRSLRQVEGEGSHLIAEFPETVDQGLSELGAGQPEHQLPRWIHLRDATLVFGGTAPLRLPLWRGRLADVSGWALGRPE